MWARGHICVPSRSASGWSTVPSTSWPVLLLIAAAHLYLVWQRLLAYLRYFQQSAYDALAAVIASGIVYAVAPLVLVAANICLAPYERQVQWAYEAQAVEKVN